MTNPMQEITREQWLQKPEADKNTWQEVWYFWNKHLKQWEESGLNPKKCGVSFEAWVEYLGKSPEQVKRMYRKASPIQGEEQPPMCNREIPMDKIRDEVREIAVAWCDMNGRPWIGDKYKLASDIQNYADWYAAALLSAKDKEIAELRQQLNSK